MFKNIWIWVLTNVFKIKTETKESEIEDNQKYAYEYERIDNINFNAIFSNKLANYVVNDSEIVVTGENERAKMFSKMSQSMWHNTKKMVSMAFGYGGVVLIPYVQGGKLYYNKIPQNRMTIDEMTGENITKATVLADRKEIRNAFVEKTYLRMTHYSVENNTLVIEQKYTDETGKEIPVPDFWLNIPLKIVISNVDRVPFAYIKSPINNRRINDKYGVPITYGTEATQLEIKECLKQIAREFDAKQVFVGVDMTMFGKDEQLPKNGIYKKFDSGKDDFWQLFDPAIRESSYFARLQELYMRLEHEIGTSSGILSDLQTHNATATEIRKAMYDTFSVTDDMRTALEKGYEDFFYACNVYANTYNITSQGDYEVNFNWSYGLVEDTENEFNQLVRGENMGVISKAEVRQWLKPDETIEEAQEKVDEIQEQYPSAEQLLGNRE